MEAQKRRQFTTNCLLFAGKDGPFSFGKGPVEINGFSVPELGQEPLQTGHRRYHSQQR